MAITTYAELQTAVKNWLHRSDLDTYIPDLITMGETRIMREVRARPMEASFTDTISSGTIALPSNYLELKYAYINRSPVQFLKRQKAQMLYEKYPTRSAAGLPKFIAREGSTFIFGPYPDGDYTVAGVYYQDIGPVSSSAHSLFTENPDLYLFAALCEAEPFMKNDKRIVVWEAKYQKIKNDVNGLRDREDLSGSDLQMVSS